MACKVDDCDGKVFGHGWCQKHYHRWLKYGDPAKVNIIRGNDTARFWGHVDKSGSCWLWTGRLNHAGYGQIRMGSMKQAHRVSYEMTFGHIPKGLVIDHLCHNRSCVRPDHLRAVSVKQNCEHKKGASRSSKTGVLGVWVDSTRTPDKFSAAVRHNGKKYHLGLFDSLEDAESAVIAKRLELFTHNEVDKAHHARTTKNGDTK